ncbi:hypothetical protein ACLOJK_000461 [Asimina triloba]
MGLPSDPLRMVEHHNNMRYILMGADLIRQAYKIFRPPGPTVVRLNAPTRRKSRSSEKHENRFQSDQTSEGVALGLLIVGGEQKGDFLPEQRRQGCGGCG